MEPLKPRADPPPARPGWRHDLGLRPGWGWLADRQFVRALLAGVVFWVVLDRLGATGPVLGLAALFSLILLQPLIEELLFRGLLQGRLIAQSWAQRSFAGFTLANWTVSVLFAAFHFINHPPLWAAGVLVPSLLYGYFRDRHDSVYPAIALHVFYNAGYFLLRLL